MEKKFSFSTEVGARKFAESVSKDFNKEFVVEGTSVCIQSPDVAAPQVKEDINFLKEYLESEMGVMRRYIWALEDETRELYNDHIKGHLPPINDADKMQKALTALGLGDSYEVKRAIVTMASQNGSVQFIVKNEKI